jgi:hypothetical protein
MIAAIFFLGTKSKGVHGETCFPPGNTASDVQLDRREYPFPADFYTSENLHGEKG